MVALDQVMLKCACIEPFPHVWKELWEWTVKGFPLHL